MPRTRNERPVSVEITGSTDGRWHGFLTVGDAQRIHRTAVMCANCKVVPDKACDCYRRCADKIRAAEDSLGRNETPTKARDPWAGQYFTDWLEGRRDEIEYGTFKSYSTVVRCYLVPNLVGQRLRGFNSRTAIKALLAKVRADVSGQAARKTLRTLKVALAHAERDRLINRNEARYVPVPKLASAIEEVVPLTRAEALAILPVIMGRRNRARWLLGMVHGKRQGECLGLMLHRPEDPRIPSDVDLDVGTFTIREKLQRRTWEHGCADPHACGARLHKTSPCPPGCARHTRTCPPPCAPTCVKHASRCPSRHGGGLVKGKPKSSASNATLAFEPLVLEAFREHLIAREAERKRAGSKWVETGHVFTTEFGLPISPESDWREFQRILSEAGLPANRVHALRHTTATFLLAANVQKRVVQELMGWSQDMTKLYQHPTDQMKRDAAAAVGSYLWGDQPQPPDDSATTLLPDSGGKILPFRRKAV